MHGYKILMAASPQLGILMEAAGTGTIDETMRK